MFGLIWHHKRAGARTRAAESARFHGRAVGRFPSARTEQNPRERPPCYYPRRRGASKSRGRAARCAVEMPAAPTPTQRSWHIIKTNYPPNEGTQTPADCALTAPPVRRINWRPSLPRLRGIGHACRHSALVAWAVTGQRRAQSTADKKTETAVRWQYNDETMTTRRDAAGLIRQLGVWCDDSGVAVWRRGDGDGSAVS